MLLEYCREIPLYCQPKTQQFARNLVGLKKTKRNKNWIVLFDEFLIGSIFYLHL
jgi:hypothetical protein